MTDLSTYELVKLWQDDDFILSRGTRADTTILVTAPAAAQLTAAGLAWLQRAYAIRDELPAVGVARPLSLVAHRGRPALVSAYPEAAVLAPQLDSATPLADVLRVAIGLASAVGQLHGRGLIHKDLKPSNVLANVATGEVWLTGFGIASRLPRERQSPEPPEGIAGTLAYMAPEQTGRMNRSIDSRSDLYALGVTLYELLAGRLPFTAHDPMEWVHCHIARQPAPLSSKTRAIPPVVADIVMKLLAKTAEARYQTAGGIEHDLRRALAEWERHGRIQAFVPGERDASDRLRTPEKLYGRSSEIEVLLSSFERVVERGDTELVLVSGYSGIGKSSVVAELHGALVTQRGLYASGKFDQYKRDIPYATLAQAFQTLIRQVLGKNPAEIEVWRDALSRALGPNGQLIAKLVPEIELVLGKQPAEPDIPPVDAAMRFQMVVRRFLAVFATAEHPLALFLDDLQWLDAATLQLLEHLVGDPEVRHLLLIGAYRENEVDASHPLAATLERLRRRSDRVHEIVLSALEIDDVSAMCADTLHVTPAVARPLAALVCEKTGGNPFFAIQFLASLGDARLIWFDASAAAWRWDIAAIRARGFTDNIVELMAGKLDRLPALTQRALWQLACMGHSARAESLRLVHGDGGGNGGDDVTVHAALQDAVLAGLVLRTGDVYTFLHDRVREAAYAMAPEAERAAEHLRIGSALAAAATPRALEDNIFEIVNHLDRGLALLGGQAERDRVAALYAIAGQRAKTATANAAARAYAATGRALLGPDGWDRNFRLSFELELLLAECDFLLADLQAAEHRLDELGARATSLVDRAAVIYLQTTLYTAMKDRSDRAIEICLDYLRHVGIDWPAHPGPAVLHAEHQDLLARIGGRSLEELANLPVSTDPEHDATIDVLVGMMTPAFNSDQALATLILCRAGNLSLAHGNSPASPLGYAFLGMMLGAGFGEYRIGSMFGELALDLVEDHGLDRHRGRVYHTLGTHVLPWTQPLASSEAWLRRGIRIMHEAGDVTYDCFGRCGLISNLLGSGEPLERVQAEADIALGLATQAKFDMGADIFVGQLRLIHGLRGLLPDPCLLDDHGRRFAGELTTSWWWIRTMQACYIYGDYPAALAAARRAEPFLALSPGFFEFADYYFYAALVRAACVDTEGDRAELLATLASCRHQLAIWVELCPETFADRLALVDAERARCEGRVLDAMEAYERAIRGARDSGFVHNEAIAFEVASRFYAGRGFDTIAQAYREHARSRYLRWGATGKVRQLDRAQGPLALSGRTGEPAAIDLDLAAMVKTSQAVTAEIGLDKLIETFMTIALEHAGASRGLLILPRDSELYIEAEATAAGDTGIVVRLRHQVARHPELPETILHYVSRTLEVVLLADARELHPFASDPYLRDQRSRSIVCIPLVKQAELIGLLYLENHLTAHAFTAAHLAVLKLLASQAATSLENASLEQENASLGEKESLLKEVHHRVKNNLQLISSLLSLQASRVTDPVVAELFAESRNRVRAMALVHENLYRAGNFAKIAMATHVRTLCAQLSRAYGLTSQHIELTTRVGDVHLDVSRAVSCGLIINELVSNALKHAFPDGRPGRVEIELRTDDGGDHVLVVRDDGIGLDVDLDVERTDSLGLQLVRDLTEQLHGTLAIRREPGATFTIAFGAGARRAPSS